MQLYLIHFRTHGIIDTLDELGYNLIEYNLNWRDYLRTKIFYLKVSDDFELTCIKRFV